MPDEKGPLYIAQQAIEPVAKDSHNQYSGYDYASAEAIIEASRKALGAGGLSVARLGYTLTVMEGYWIVNSTYRVVGDPSYKEDIVRSFPLIPQKSKPLDKMLATALTSDLGYFLRDLLLIPRVGVDESMDSRNDEHSATASRSPPRRREPPQDFELTPGPEVAVSSEASAITPQSYQQVNRLIEETNTSQAAFLEHFGVTDLSLLSEAQAAQAKLMLMKKKAQRGS